MSDPLPRDETIECIIEGLWASILDEQLQTHQSTQSAYRFCTVFLSYFAKQDGCTCPAIEGPEQRFFDDVLMRHIKGMPYNDRERAHILGSLFERLCTSIARPHKLGT